MRGGKNLTVTLCFHLLNPTLDAEAAVFCAVSSTEGVQNNSQNKAVVCVKGTGCPGCSESVWQLDDTAALPIKSVSPWEHWAALAPPTTPGAVGWSELRCSCKNASGIQAPFSRQPITGVVTDMDLKP